MSQLSFTVIKSTKTDTWINHILGTNRDKLVIKEDRASLTLEDVILLEDLSTRAINLCKKYHLLTLADMINYFSIYRSFAFLSGSGRKTDKELSEVCRKHAEIKTNDAFNGPQVQQFQFLESCTYIIKKDEQKFFLWRLMVASNNLEGSTKTKMATILSSENPFKAINKFYRNLHKVYFMKTRDFFSAKRLHLFFQKQLSWFKEHIIDKRHLLTTREKQFFRFKLDMMANFQIDESYLNSLKDDFVNKNFKIFHFLEKVILKESFFKNKKRYYVYLHNLGFNNLHPIHKIDTTKEKFKVTRQAVCQIKDSILLRLKKVIAKFKIYIGNMSPSPYRSKRHLIVINQQLVNHINEQEGTNLTLRFLMFISNILVTEPKQILGLNLKFPSSSIYTPYLSKNKNSLSNFYLLNNSSFDKQLIKNLLIDLVKQLQSSITSNKVINLPDYCQKFGLSTNAATIKLITKIVRAEFHHKVISKRHSYKSVLIKGNELILNKNQPKKAREYIYDVLEKLGKPSTIRIIEKQFVQMFPKIKLTTSISVILKAKDTFTYLGSPSIYGLKKWEQSGIYVGGTIRNMVLTFLQKENMPLHINDITAKVKVFRNNTNGKSIFRNLKQIPADSSKFIFFPNRHIGLKNKVYKHYN